jgi:hypothetical protein
MLVLYKWFLADPPAEHYVALSKEESDALLRKAHLRLRERGYAEVADILTNFHFEIVHPHDLTKKSLRAATTDLDLIRLRRIPSDIFRELARAMGQVGCYVQRIFVEVEASPDAKASAAACPIHRTKGLRPNEVDAVIHGYIGLQHGNLGNFTLQSLEEFYRDLGLHIDVSRYTGSVRSRFQTILTEADSRTQALILDGVLNRFRVGSSLLRTPEREAEICLLIDRLLGVDRKRPVFPSSFVSPARAPRLAVFRQASTAAARRLD